MQDLTPVGLSKDGKRLVLISSSGEEFAVAVDTRFRAALRGDNARAGQLEMKMESALRPRDIQARIRAGESLEEVATAAQTTVEGIMAFATPVLAERAHVARGAMTCSVRRKSTESSTAARTLGVAAEMHFTEHGLHEEDVEWDAWRRPDGRWALVASYAVKGRPRRAEFTHDLRGRFVVSDNDDARLLTGELREPTPAAPTTAGPPRRLVPVPAQDELPLGDDAIELVRDTPAVPPAPVAHHATDESTALPSAFASADEAPRPAPVPEVAHVESPPAPEPPVARPEFDLTADHADADWITTRRPERQNSAADPVADTELTVPVPRPEDTPAEEPAPGSPETSGPIDTEVPPAAPEAEEAAAPPEEPPPAPRKPARKKGRSSVPSWDEIMFGGGKAD